MNQFQLKKSFLLLVLAVMVSNALCQNIPRKASLGAEMEKVTEGLKVVKPVEGTALNVKLKSGDIIKAVNQDTIDDFPALMKILAQKRHGDKADLSVLRHGKLVKLSGKFVGRSLEKSEYSDVIYDEVKFKDGFLRVIINKPKKEGKFPAMLFIPGYPCTSLDNLRDNHPYKRIIQAYEKAGFVTVRVEKSGVGDSYNTPECESIGLYDEIENFEAGLKKLISLPYVDTGKIILVGHSIGGAIAPALSAKNDVAGVVVYGTTTKSWFEYQLEMYRVQNLLAGLDPLEYEQSITDQYDLTYRFFIKKESLKELAKDPKNNEILRQQWMYDGNDKIFGRSEEYWRQIQDLKRLENWKNTKSKVLVQFGESDFQAFSKADHEQIVRTVNYYNPGNASLQVFPLTDHYFAKSGTMQEAYNKFSNQQILQLFDEFNFDVINAAVDWSVNVIGRHPGESENEFKWVQLNTEAYAGKQDDIYFIDERTGWYINGTGSVYHTKNSGASWEKLFEKKGSFFRTIAFLNENIGFLGTVGTDYFPNVTDTIPLYQTSDGGKTWVSVKYNGPYVKGLCAIDIVKEQFINHGTTDYKYHIYAAGRVGSPANIIVSHDAGTTWNSWSMNDYCKMVFDIKMLNKNVGFACAATDEDISKSNALILKTSDGGKTWKKVYQSGRPFETTWKISFPTEQTGYATIQSYNPDTNIKQQHVAKTTDGGDTWVELDLVEDAGAREFGIGFIDDMHGFVGTLNSGFETKDGGKTWSKVNLGRACNKVRIYADNDRVYGYAIGVNLFRLAK